MSDYNFIKGYAKEKLNKILNVIDTSWFFKEKEGRYFFKNKYKLKDRNNKNISKKTFERKNIKQIKNDMDYYLTQDIEKLKTNLHKLEKLRIEINNCHPLNFNPKKTPSLFEQKYINKFYIHNGGIQQIVRIKHCFSSIVLLIAKPSGKLTEKTLPKDVFTKKILFDSRKEIEDYLLNVWIKENKIPKYRETYIMDLFKKRTIKIEGK